MTDLVKRLRGRPAPGDHCSKLIAEAADEIERLEAERLELQQAAQIEAGLRRELVIEIERLRADKDQLIAIAADEISQRVDEIAGLIHRLREAATANERLRADNLRLVAIIARNETHYQAARDDGTVIAVGGEPGASAGKSE